MYMTVRSVLAYYTPPMFRGIWTSYDYHMYILKKKLKVTNVRIVRAPFLTGPFSIKGAAAVKKIIRHKNFTTRKGSSLRSMPLCVPDYILCIQYLIFKQRYITG